MDLIPLAFYGLIQEELKPLTDEIPAVLTRKFLTSYGCLGSPVNPMVYLDIPPDFMVRYGAIFFSDEINAPPCIPQDNLIGSDIYLKSDGIYRHVAKIIKNDSNTSGIAIDPVYLKHVNGRSHHYVNIGIQIESRDNTDIIHLIYNGHRGVLLYIDNGKLVRAQLNITWYLQEQIKCLYRLNDFSETYGKIESLGTHEILYLEVILKDKRLVCPYAHLQSLRQEIYHAQEQLKNIMTQFNIALEIGDSEHGLITLVQQLDIPSSYQIIKILERQMWELADYILTRVDFTRALRVPVVLELLEKPGILKHVKADILLNLYNWREHHVTQSLSNILIDQGQRQLAIRLQTTPFKPSPLNKVSNSIDISMPMPPVSVRG